MIPAARTARTARTARSTRLARRLALTLAGLGVVVSVSSCGIQLPEGVTFDPNGEIVPAEQPTTTPVTTPVTTPDTTPETTPDTTPGEGDEPMNPTTPPVMLPDYQTTVPVNLPPSTEAPAADPAPLPAGALDLGLGVHLVPSGAWTGSIDGDVATLTDGTLTAQIQMVARTAGEHPGILLGEYVALIEDGVEALSVSPARLVWSTDDPRQIEMYTVFFSTYDATAEFGRGTDGGVTMLVRDDGLVLISEVAGPAGADGSLPDDTWSGLIDTFLATPAIAEPVALTPIEDFRVTTAQAPVIVDGLAGFSLAPGFQVVDEGEAATVVSNGANDLLVALLPAEDGIEDFVQRAVDYAAGLGATDFDVVIEHGVDGFGVDHREIGWRGSCNGESCGGAIDVFVDVASGRAFLLSSSWDWNPADGSRPDAAAHRFMYHSMVHSFENIPA